MGGFYGSIQFRTEDRETVRSVLQHLAGSGEQRFLLAPPRNGWVAAFPSGSGQDERVALAAAARFPGELLHVLVHDDDILAYLLLRGGREVDRYNSKPDYFGQVEEEERQACRGRPDRLAHLLVAGHTARELEDLLRVATGELFAVHSLQEFADLLGLPYAVMSYEYLMRGETDEVDGWDEFEHIPDRAPEIAAERAAADAVDRGWERLRSSGLVLAEVPAPPSGTLPSMPRLVPDPDGPGPLLGWTPFTPQSTTSLWRLGPPWGGVPQQVAVPFPTATHFVDVSPDGRYLLAATPAGTTWSAAIWDFRTGARLADVAGAAGQACWSRFAPDASAVISASPSEVAVFAVPGGARLGTIALEVSGGLTGAIHPSGRLVLADGMGRLWLASLPAGPLGPRLFSGGAANFGALQAYLTAMGGPPSAPPPDIDEQVNSLREALEQNIRRLVEAMRRRPNPAFGSPEEYQARAQEQIERQLAEHRERLQRAVRDQRTGWPEQGLDPVREMAFTPDGRRLVCSTNRGLRVYDWDQLQAATGSTPPPLFAFDTASVDPRFAGMPVAPAEPVTALAIEASGGRLLFADTRGRISAMSLADGTVRTLVEMPGQAIVSQLALSRDGAVLVTVCCPRPRMDRAPEHPAPVVRVWDLAALSAGG